jgi:hypothetical protein
MMLGSFVRLYEDTNTGRREASSTTPEVATPPKSGPSTRAPPIDTTILEHCEVMLQGPDHDDTIDTYWPIPGFDWEKKDLSKIDHNV